jgi:Cu/Ag efflux protein CusF
MVMWFKVEAPDLLEGLASGDQVLFDFRADGTDYLITNLEKTP